MPAMVSAIFFFFENRAGGLIPSAPGQRIGPRRDATRAVDPSGRNGQDPGGGQRPAPEGAILAAVAIIPGVWTASPKFSKLPSALVLVR